MNKVLVSLVFLVLCSCAKDGATGPTGANGADGQSIQGPQGNPGADGQDATPVTIVQLCTAPTVYPSTFTEIAFCIGSKLYGTYSVNGGFSGEIVPGTYNSKGINSSCSFTVSDNCVVTH